MHWLRRHYVGNVIAGAFRVKHMMSIKQSTPGETNRRRAHLPLPVSYFGFSNAFSCEMFPIEAFND